VRKRYSTSNGSPVSSEHDVAPRRPERRRRVEPGVLLPARVQIRGVPLGGGRPDDLRHRVRELAVALLADAPFLGERGLPQELRLPAKLDALAEEIDEDADLRAQDRGVEGLEDVVDRARVVAAEHVPALLRDRGEEDDGNVSCALAPADQLGGLEAIELRHLDVHQDQGELLAQQPAQGLDP